MGLAYNENTIYFQYSGVLRWRDARKCKAEGGIKVEEQYAQRAEADGIFACCADCGRHSRGSGQRGGRFIVPCGAKICR